MVFQHNPHGPHFPPLWRTRAKMKRRLRKFFRSLFVFMIPVRRVTRAERSSSVMMRRCKAHHGYGARSECVEERAPRGATGSTTPWHPVAIGSISVPEKIPATPLRHTPGVAVDWSETRPALSQSTELLDTLEREPGSLRTNRTERRATSGHCPSST